MFSQLPTFSSLKLIGIVTLITTVTAGCVSKSSLPHTHSPDAATVTLYRSGELQGSLTDVYIGWGDDYFISLSPEERTQFTIEPGFKTFKIRAHADWSNELTVNLAPHQSVCLIAEVNPQNVVGLNWVVSGYRLRQLACDNLNL